MEQPDDAIGSLEIDFVYRSGILAQAQKAGARKIPPAEMAPSAASSAQIKGLLTYFRGFSQNLNA
jgi:hypothetical protein